LGSIVFLGLAIGMGIRATRVPDESVGAICVGAIFALGFLAFVAYGLVLMLAPWRALRSTSQPIFIVDGYVRYRPPDERSEYGMSGYVAVLTADAATVACEWPAFGMRPLEENVHPAHVEFSEYGGIHKIDGQNTGALPDEITTLGVGLTAKR
jgi:hypothetical protein